MQDCIFCKISRDEIESQKLFENELLYVIKDIAPKAPVHLLIIPKTHIASINDLSVSQQSLIGELVLQAKEQATKFGIAQSGYKLIWNVGADGGQVVPHIHLHLLGGKKLKE
ncbi:MAG: histidine triad nucleotide-binding protein [Candidatus Doudnabacteria bacterium]